MKTFKRCAIGFFATALLGLSTSSALAAPTATFSSSVNIQNVITVTKVAELNFGIINAPTAGTRNFTISDSGTSASVALSTVVGADGGNAGTGGTFVSGQTIGRVSVFSPSVDAVTISIGAPSACAAGTGTGTTPILKNLAFLNTGIGGDVTTIEFSLIEGTLTVADSAQGTWTCEFIVSANF